MTRNPRWAVGVLAASAAALVFSLVQPAAAVDFSGKRIEWIIPFGTGGGSARWARFYAPRPCQASSGIPGCCRKAYAGRQLNQGKQFLRPQGDQ